MWPRCKVRSAMRSCDTSAPSRPAVSTHQRQDRLTRTDWRVHQSPQTIARDGGIDPRIRDESAAIGQWVEGGRAIRAPSTSARGKPFKSARFWIDPSATAGCGRHGNEGGRGWRKEIASLPWRWRACMRSSTRSKRCMTPGRRERILENQRRRIPAAAGIIPGGKDMTTRGMIGGEHRCLRSGGTDCRFLRPAGGFLCFNCCSQNGWERRHPAGGAASQFLPLRPSICLSFHLSFFLRYLLFNCCYGFLF